MICEHGWTSAIDCDACTRRRVAPDTAALEARIDYLESAILAADAELARVRRAHQAILNEILYGGTDLKDEPDIDRIHDFAKVGLADMMRGGTQEED